MDIIGIALCLAILGLLLNVAIGVGLVVLAIDYLSGKKSSHQITMLNPETQELEQLVTRDFKMPEAPEDQIPGVSEAAKKAFEDRFDTEYDNLS